MSQYEQYTEAGPSSQIPSSQTGIHPLPSFLCGIGVSDEPLTPEQSISQQPLSSRPASDFFPSESNPTPLSLRRIGPTSQKFWVLWTEMNKIVFIEWWRHTAGAHPHAPFRKVNFEARYTAEAWQHFDQVAHFETGKPMALCRRCGKALPHPSATSNGSKSLNAHWASRTCKLTGQKTSTQQDIQQSLELSVLYTLCSISSQFNTNLYLRFRLLARLPEGCSTNSDLREPKLNSSQTHAFRFRSSDIKCRNEIVGTYSSLHDREAIPSPLRMLFEWDCYSIRFTTVTPWPHHPNEA